MSRPAILVENLSKQYRIGRRSTHADHLRGRLAELAAAPFQRLLGRRSEVGGRRSGVRGQSSDGGDDSPAASHQSPVTSHHPGDSQPSTLNPQPSTDHSPPADPADTMWALKDVSFEVQPGEVVGIIGRNGAGKSTLLKILSRIVEPTSGRATLRGRVGSLLEVGTGFHPELTGRENVYLNGAILGMSKPEIDRKFDEIVDFSGVEQFIDTPVKRYSSGMGVRLGFAVAAFLEPEILIVDEVLAVGDAEFRQRCMTAVNQVARDGRTVLLVSHQLGLVRSLCNRAILLTSGSIATQGHPPQVCDLYTSHHRHTSYEWTVTTPNELPLSVQRVTAASPCRIEDAFDVSYPITLIVEHKCRTPLSGSVVLLQVFHNGIELIHTFDTDSHPERLVRRQPGRYLDTVTIPARIFKPGIFSVSFRTAVLHRGQTFDDQEHAITVPLVDDSEDTSFSGYSSTRSGILRLSPQWAASPP